MAEGQVADIPDGYPFASDEARLQCLFNLYEKMTSGNCVSRGCHVPGR
jgi:hypothetical protein